MQLLPSLPAGALIVELAAGAGRFTPLLAQHAEKVIANDFIPEFIALNRTRCAAEGCLFVHESADDATPPEIPADEPYSAEYPARYRHHEWYRTALADAARTHGEFTLTEFDLAGLYERSQSPGVQPAWLLRLL